MVGGLATSFLLELFVYPVLYAAWKWRIEMREGRRVPVREPAGVTPLAAA